MITEAMRRHALARGVMDIPNARSSHTIPTPRGGGLAIVVTSLMATLATTVSGSLPVRTSLALLIGGCAIAAVGWFDDKNHLSIRLRFVVHTMSAACAVIMLGGVQSFRIGPVALSSPIILSAIAVVGIVWAVNLFNFMDGIDGIAGTQTACVSLGGGAMLMLGGETGLAYCMLALGAAALGFLVLNWHPAKIFMGDVGSGFIGFYVATVAVASDRVSAVPLLLWVMMMAVFVVDATGTLICRIVEGHPWSEAHRSHVYQLAVRSGFSHDRVALVVCIVDCLLVSIAFLSMRRPDLASAISVVVLAAVFVAWVRLRRRLQVRVARVESASTGS